MHLDQLRLFRDLAQQRSVSRAAKMNGISQSAASQCVQELEKSLRVQMIDRSTRPVTITPAGRLYLDFCRDVIRRQQLLQAELEQMRGQVEGSVRVASIYSVGLSEMTRIEQEFRRRHPGAELRVDLLRPEKVYEAVESDAADLGLVSFAESRRGLQAIAWRRERMVVALSPRHPLASRQVLAAADLEGQPFVAFDEDLPISREIRRYFRDHSVEVSAVMHFDNIPAMKEAVAAGNGVSILPEPVLRQDIEQGRMAAIPLEPGLFRPVGILHRRKKVFNRAGQALLDLLREEEPA